MQRLRRFFFTTC